MEEKNIALIQEYIQQVSEQMRNTKIKKSVLRELESHIEDQAQDYVKMGDEEEEAAQKAIRDMGDPVGVGVSLDRVHRPHLEFRFLFLVALISLCSIAVQYILTHNDGNAYYFHRHLGAVAAGLVLMAVAYRLDYSFILGKSRFLAAAVIGLRTLFLLFSDYFGNSIYSARKWGNILFLYPILFAGILYEYRGKGKEAVFKGALWGILPFLLCIPFPNMLVFPSTQGMVVIFQTLLALFLTALLSKWYATRHEKLLTAGILLVFFAVPLMLFAYIKNLNPEDWTGGSYQIQRFQSWLNQYSMEPEGYGYIPLQIKKVFDNSVWIGKSEESVRLLNNLQEFNQDYVLAGMTAYLGRAATIFLLVLAFFLAACMIRIAFRQNNLLGKMVGMACGSILLLEILFNILVVLWILPLTSATMPFLSCGGINMLISYILLGIVLSIYRYKDILEPKEECNGAKLIIPF